MIMAVPIPGATTRTGVPRAPPRAASIAANTKTVVKRMGILIPIALAISRSDAEARIILPHQVFSRISQRAMATANPAKMMKRL